MDPVGRPQSKRPVTNNARTKSAQRTVIVSPCGAICVMEPIDQKKKEGKNPAPSAEPQKTHPSKERLSWHAHARMPKDRIPKGNRRSENKLGSNDPHLARP